MRPAFHFDDTGRYPVIRTSVDRRLPSGTRALVIRRDHFRCVFCDGRGHLEVDHIIPWSAGGGDDMDNLRTLCRDCNQTRSNFYVPGDSMRRLPTAHQCITCCPDLLGDSELRPVYCIVCNRKGPGLPLREVAPHGA